MDTTQLKRIAYLANYNLKHGTASLAADFPSGFRENAL